MGCCRQKAVVADPHKAFGQDVEEPSADELDGIERDGFPDSGVAGFAAKEDASVGVAALEALFGEGGFGDVGGGVAQRGLAAANVFAVDAPLGLPDGRIDAGVQFGIFFGEAGVERRASLPADDVAKETLLNLAALVVADLGNVQVNQRRFEASRVRDTG